MLPIAIAGALFVWAPAAVSADEGFPELPSMASIKETAAKLEVPPIDGRPASRRSILESARQAGAQLAVQKKPEPHKKLFLASEAYAWGGYAFDMGTTVVGLRAGAREAGALATLARQSPALMVAASAGLELLGAVAARAIYKSGHPKAAAVVNFVRGSIHTGAGVHNLSVIERQRQLR